MRFSEKLAFVWNFNLGKYELGETREINFKAAFKILRWGLKNSEKNRFFFRIDWE